MIGCSSRYYPDFYITNTTKKRLYYGHIPHAISISPHVVIEASLCKRFANYAACAWY